MLSTELFVPLIAVDVVDSLDEAFELANDAAGLTAGFFSKDRAEVDQFLACIEAGVVYVNRKAGATTGAWRGAALRRVEGLGQWRQGRGRALLPAAVPERAEPHDRGGAAMTEHLVQSLADAAPALVTELPGPLARQAIARDSPCRARPCRASSTGPGGGPRDASSRTWTATASSI